jgi:hypothetical protein
MIKLDLSLDLGHVHLDPLGISEHLTWLDLVLKVLYLDHSIY